MRTLALILLLLAPQEAKRPEPAEAERKAALKSIQDIFKDEYSRKSADDRRKLGRKLLEQAATTKDDAPSEYTLLQESRRLSAESGDVDTALRAVSELGRRFEIETLPLRAATLTAVSQAAKTPDDLSACALQYIALSDAASEALDLATAEKALTSAAALAKSAKNVALFSRVEAKVKRLSAHKSKLVAVKKAQEILAKDPEYAEANGLVGTFVSFTQEDWPRGLPFLAKGPKNGGRDAAELDLANPTDGPKQAELGDAWWSYAESAPEEHKKAIRRRASTWYERARAGLLGLAKAKVEKRLSEVPAPEVSVPADADPAAAERWKPTPPLTLSSKQATLRDAISTLVQESGTPISLGDVDPNTRIAYKIDAAGFTGTLEALCRAGGVAYAWNQEGTDIVLTKAKWLDTAWTHFGPFVLIGRVTKAPSDPAKSALFLYFDWEPQVKPVWYEIAVESVTSDAGAPIQVVVPQTGAGLTRDPNLQGRNHERAKIIPRREDQRDVVMIDPPVPVGKKLSSVRGKVDVYFPLKWSRARFDNPAPEAKAPAGPHQVSMSWFAPRKPEEPWIISFSLEMATVPVEKRYPVYGATLEAKVRFLDGGGKELAAEFQGGAGGTGFGTRETFQRGNRSWLVRGLPATETPKRAEIELVTDVWVRSYAFELKDVPHPALPGPK